MNNKSYLDYRASVMGKVLDLIWSNRFSPVQYLSSIFLYSKSVATSKDISELAKSYCYWRRKKKKLSYNHGNKNSKSIILLPLSFGLRISHLFNVQTFCQLLLAEKVLLLFIIMIIGLQSGLLTTHLLVYSLYKIILLS